MSDLEGFERARTLAEAVLAAMLQQGIAPTPRNYTLWYAHLSGSAPDLSQTLGILMSNGQQFTEERNEELYRRFGDAPSPMGAIREAGDHLQQTMSEILSHIKDANGDARAYGEKLDHYSNQLNGRPSADSLPEIISGLLAETQQIAARNELLETQLEQSSGEIRDLRLSLASVQREATTDALTGIANRKVFDLRLRDAATEAMESGDPLSLLFIDIDHFKRFNDTYGHQLGDQVLRLVAKTLTDSVKGRDTPTRYGGEEFAIILPHTRLADATRLADQIRRTMMTRRIVSKNSREDYGHVTLSIGISLYVPGEKLDAMVQRADSALYQAKRSGRNRVVNEEELAADRLPAPVRALGRSA